MSLSSNSAHSVCTFVSINNRDMRLIDFMNAFPDEASCKSKLKEYREKQGVVCPHCGCTQHYWKKMLRVQALSLQAESQGQQRDARQSAWAQELQSYMGTAS